MNPFKPNRLLVFALILLASTLSALAEEPSAALQDAERAELIQLLEASRSETEALAAQATGDHWTLKPAPDKWAVGEVVEHLARAEEVIFGLAFAALTTEAEPDWQAMSEGGFEPLVTALRDRTQKFQAPEILQPTGEKDRAETLRWYAANRAGTIDFTLSTEAPVKAHFAEGPPGRMSIDKWLALIGAHNQRHNAQIREVLEWIESGAEPMEAAPVEVEPVETEATSSRR